MRSLVNQLSTSFLSFPSFSSSKSIPGGRPRATPFALALLLVAFVVPVRWMQAQGLYQFPASVAVGAPALTETVTVSMQQGGTASAIQALTQGAPNVDYTVAGGTCSASGTYAVGNTCTVTVGFQPKYPGARHGAVVVSQSDGTVLGTEYLEGAATGALSVLVPGEINTVAGDVNWIYSGDNIPATQAAIFLPMGEVTDAAGNLYIADTNNNRVRRVDAVSKMITTVAGGYAPGYSGDGGQGTAALLNTPTALAIDGAGNLFIADSANYVIRMLNTVSGVITTVAGNGSSGSTGDSGAAISAQLSGVNGLAIDSQHQLYLADTGNNTIRVVNLATGVITKFAGTGTPGYSGDHGPALAATFRVPQGIGFGPDGSLYIADLDNNVVRRIDTGGTVTTVAGGGNIANGLGDGGPATSAVLALPAGVAVDQAGNLFIADAVNNRIRKVTAAGVISTLSGTGAEAFAGDGGNADQAQLYGPYSIYYDGQGNLFIGDMFHNRIREISGNTAAWQYDPIRVDRTSPPKLQGIENDGNDDLSLQAPVFVNASLDSATTTCALPQTLAMGVNCVMGVAFSPTVLGNNVLGSVTLNSNAGNSPATVNLSGQVLSVDPTAVTVVSSQNPSAFNVAVTFTAHVTTQGTSLTGTVQFQDGGVTIGTGTLTASGTTGTASFATSALALGSHSITAVYSGDSTNATSTSTVLIQSVKQPTTLVLQTSANPSLESVAITLTSQITASGGVMPTGTIAFSSDGVSLGSGTLNGSGVATVTVSTLTIGTHHLVASYEGDNNNGPSQSNTVNQVVQGQGSTITLATSNASIPVGTPVTFSVQVTGSNTPIASGTVAFRDGANALGTATLNGVGAASFQTTALTAGPHTITAVYSGDTNYAGSTSTPLGETVLQLATTTSVSSSANPAPAGAAIVLTASVAATESHPTGGPIGGVVTFLNGGKTLGSATLGANQMATLSIATIPLGQNNITAVYQGGTNYLGSTAAPLELTVQQATSATALTTSGTPSVAEDTVTLTATVTTNGGRATGVVTFSDGGTAIGQGTLNAQGIATLATSTLTVGQHGLVASYAGDTQDLGSVSTALTQVVTLRPTVDVLTNSATSLSGGQQVTLISVVQWTGAIVPTGTVTFQSGSTTLGASTIDSSGVAALTVNPQVGLTSVSSIYSGDSVYAGSTATAISISVGTPPDFTMHVSQTALSMQSLQHDTVTLTVASEKGFADKLTLGCLGLPKAATCTFSQDWMTLAANGSNAVTIVVDTGSPLTAGSVAKNDGSAAPRVTSPLIAICGLPVGAFFCLAFWKGRRRSLAGLLLALCALGATAGLSGCGTLTTNGTPAGTYPFQITASATGVGVLQAVNMTLTVTK